MALVGTDRSVDGRTVGVGRPVVTCGNRLAGALEPMGTDRSVHGRAFRTGRADRIRGQSGQSPSGVTLIEMLIAMAIIGLMAAMATPSITAGLDSLRLRSASDQIIGFLNVALSRADTRQQAVEVVISPADGTITARSSDNGFNRKLEVASPIKILSVQPAPAASLEEAAAPRRFLLYPGGAPPKITIEIGNSSGRKRLVSIDPVTGVPQSDGKASEK